MGTGGDLGDTGWMDGLGWVVSGVGGARPGGDRMGLRRDGVTLVGLRGATAPRPGGKVAGPLANGSKDVLLGGMLPARVVVCGLGRVCVGKDGRLHTGGALVLPMGGRVAPPSGGRGLVVRKGGDRGERGAGRGDVGPPSPETSSSDEVYGDPFLTTDRPSLGPLPFSGGLRPVRDIGGSRCGLIAPGSVAVPEEPGSSPPRALRACAATVAPRRGGRVVL